MNNFLILNSEFSECLWYILHEPTAPDVEYYFFRMEELKKELRSYVEEAQMLDRLHMEGDYE